MQQNDLLRYVGSIQQVAYARRIQYSEGRAANLRAIQVKNGALSFLVMEDKALDIAELSYHGVQMNYLAKTGLIGRNPYDTHGAEALRSIMGGFFFTCGLENICAPYAAEGKEYPMHGRMRTTPAEHVCVDAAWKDGRYCITISGEMREAEIFGENLLLRRTITTVYGEETITISDEIVNESFRPEPVMFMYHCNFGFPFLQEGCRLVLPTKKVIPREHLSELHLADYDKIEPPKDNEMEYVFLHELCSDARGNTFVAIVNDRDSLAVQLHFNRNQLPYFMEWKSCASGDFALGLEPSNSSVYGRGFHEKEHTLHLLDPQKSESYAVTFAFSHSAESISNLDQAVNDMKRGERK